MIAAAGTCFWPAWPQALAAGTDDVLRHLVDQHHIAGQPLYDGLVDALEVVRDQRPDLF
jgi:hypothetical protein